MTPAADVIAGAEMGCFRVGQPGERGALCDGTYRAYGEASARVQGLKRGGSRFSRLGGLENQKSSY